MYISLIESKHAAGYKYIFSSGEHRIKTCSKCNQGANSATHLDAPGVRLDQPIQHPQQRRLARPIAADQPQALSPPQLEAHILHRPELVWPQLHIGAALRQSTTPAMAAASDLAAQVLQAIPERTLEAAAEPLAHVLHSHQHVVAHLRHSSARSGSASPADTPSTPAAAAPLSHPPPAPTHPAAAAAGR